MSSESAGHFDFASGNAVGATCPHCRQEIDDAEEIATCDTCGTVHHAMCWRQLGCGAYQCARSLGSDGRDHAGTLRITSEEIDDAVPLPSRDELVSFRESSARRFANQPEGKNRVAVASFIVGIAGIPFFGIITGFVAILLGALAIGKRSSRGTGLAICGIVLGVIGMAGWGIGLMLFFHRAEPAVQLLDFEPDMKALDSLPDPINRSMKANVLVESGHGWIAMGIGSGVILRIANGRALIVTNRHVVDSRFAMEEDAAARPKPVDETLRVKLIGQEPKQATVEWIAPDGIDLALISVPAVTQKALAARIHDSDPPPVGSDVYAIGNPQGLGWTHTKGGLSQYRIQHLGQHDVHVVQTSAAINPGNSGGGLYAADGTLIGINTWTNDKRVSEGLSFAIGIQTLVDLAPDRFKLESVKAPSPEPPERDEPIADDGK